MAAPSPADRIIQHMNGDHADSVQRYLQAYSGVSSFAARNAVITDMTLASMTLRTSAPKAGKHRDAKTGLYTIPLDPPLASWSEARTRLVAMDAECLKKLGRSDITITQYHPPAGFGAVVALTVVATFALMFRRENLVPGGHGAWYPWRLVGEKFPQVAEFLYNLQPKLFWPVLGIHIAEMVWLDASRLSKHSVPRGSGLWWKYMGTHFFEGFTSFVRFDKAVAAKKAEKEKRQH